MLWRQRESKVSESFKASLVCFSGFTGSRADPCSLSCAVNHLTPLCQPSLVWGERPWCVDRKTPVCARFSTRSRHTNGQTHRYSTCFRNIFFCKHGDHNLMLNWETTLPTWRKITFEICFISHICNIILWDSSEITWLNLPASQMFLLCKSLQ